MQEPRIQATRQEQTQCPKGSPHPITGFPRVFLQVRPVLELGCPLPTYPPRVRALASPAATQSRVTLSERRVLPRPQDRRVGGLPLRRRTDRGPAAGAVPGASGARAARALGSPGHLLLVVLSPALAARPLRFLSP